MEVNGWRLYQYKLLTDELNRLIAEVEKLRQSQPDEYKQHPKTKRLARIRELMLKEIPADPSHERWQQGNTLGPDFGLWKRAKFGQNRFRLFFRYDSSAKVIIYAWVNNASTLRKAGDKNDPYAVFEKGLQKGNPPSDLKELLKRCRQVQPL
jgi:toxin YhaV